MKRTQLVRLVLLLFIVVVSTSCSKDDGSSQPAPDPYANFSTLFVTTDYLVGKIPSYGSAGYESKTSSDGKYRAYVLGRIIVVQKKGCSCRII